MIQWQKIVSGDPRGKGHECVGHLHGDVALETKEHLRSSRIPIFFFFVIATFPGEDSTCVLTAKALKADLVLKPIKSVQES